MHTLFIQITTYNTVSQIPLNVKYWKTKIVLNNQAVQKIRGKTTVLDQGNEIMLGLSDQEERKTRDSHFGIPLYTIFNGYNWCNN